MTEWLNDWIILMTHEPAYFWLYTKGWGDIVHCKLLFTFFWVVYFWRRFFFITQNPINHE